MPGLSTVRAIAFFVLYLVVVALPGFIFGIFVVPIGLIKVEFARELCRTLLQGLVYMNEVLLEMAGSKVLVTGDYIRSEDRAILVGNHEIDFDMFFGGSALFQAYHPSLDTINIFGVIASFMKYVPFIGWGLQMCCTLFVERQWELDESRFEKYFKYHIDRNAPFQMVILPEAEALNAPRLKIRNKEAAKRGLPPRTYTLYPKTRGFCHVIEFLRKNNAIDAIYDATMCQPEPAVRFVDGTLLWRGFPKLVMVEIKRIPFEKLPKDSEGVKNWLADRWEQKEERMKILKENWDKFIAESEFISAADERRTILKKCLILWLTISGFILLLCRYSVLFRYCIYVGLLFFFCISWLPMGSISLEIWLYRLQQSIKSKFRNLLRMRSKEG